MRVLPLPLLLILVGCSSEGPSADAGLDSAADAVVDVATLCCNDAGPDAPEATDAAVDPNAPRFVRYWGGLGREPGQFIEPSSIEIDSEGFVYVAGHEDRFQKFTGEGERVAIYGTAGAGDGEFNHPHGLAVDRRRDDLIYVGDQENNRLQVFMPDGTFVRAWGDEFFLHIHDVGIDPATGDIFVGDLESNILRRFTATGEEIWRTGTTGGREGEFDGIWGMSTDSLGNVYIAESGNRRVQVFDREGVFLRTWDSYEGTRFTKPTGVFVDVMDVVYVCDSLAMEVLLFDTNGGAIGRWDLGALIDFDVEPEDIVLDETRTNIYIAEVRQHRVLHLRQSLP